MRERASASAHQPGRSLALRKVLFFVFLFVFLTSCTVFPYQLRQGAVPVMPVACTEEAKVCPDGSAVGRTGPNCEFAPCPVNGKEFCETDDDCICNGLDTQTGNCFVGSKKYYDLFVDKEKVCPDFCTGIAGDRETRCINTRCVIAKREKPLPVNPSMEIIADPLTGVMPLVINFTAVLHNVDSNDKNFYCTAQHWSFGDNNEESVEPSCVPWFPEANVPTRYSTIHRYERPGTYNVSFNLGTLRAVQASIFVLPESFPPECDEDSDCIPAQCCHAVDCIIKEKATECRTNLCTKDCLPGTLDCGGSCACIAGRCEGKNFLPGKITRAKPLPWGTI